MPVGCRDGLREPGEAPKYYFRLPATPAIEDNSNAITQPFPFPYYSIYYPANAGIWQCGGVFEDISESENAAHDHAPANAATQL
jgi:hypothetical protein